MAGEGIEEGELATFIMDSDGRAFTLIYVWHGDDEDAVTVKKRVRLAEIPRGFGHEIVFRCPVCERRCKRLALRRYGLGCAKCLDIVWGSNREGKCARLARRATYIAHDLGLQSWAEQPVKKPKHMRLRRYLHLLDQRQRVLGKIARHLATRRRLAGDNTMHLGNLLQAIRVE